MKYVECPNRLALDDPKPRVFLAGGISGCPNWQSFLVALLGYEPSVTLLNPRRDDFPIDDPNAAEAQILWERNHLLFADIISFWFPKETLCPIALYELGRWTELCHVQNKPLIIGIEPGYARESDIRIQSKYSRPHGKEIPIVNNLHSLADTIKSYL